MTDYVPWQNKDEASINKRIILFLAINVILLAIQLLVFPGLPEELFERILFITAGIIFGINILLLTSLYNPQQIIDVGGREMDNSVRTKIIIGMISLVFLFWGIVAFLWFLGLHYLVK